MHQLSGNGPKLGLRLPEYITFSEGGTWQGDGELTAPQLVLQLQLRKKMCKLPLGAVCWVPIYFCEGKQSNNTMTLDIPAIAGDGLAYFACTFWILVQKFDIF